MTRPSTRRRARPHLIALSLYTLLALVLSWPLIAQIASHTPGVPQWAFDESTFVWNIWYLKHALVDNLSNPLHTELIWYPLGIDLILYTYNFFHALIAQPLAVAVNLAVASNVSLLLSTVLSGYGTFLLVRWLLKKVKIEDSKLDAADQSSIFNLQFLAAFIAGLVYAFASNRAIYAALGHYDMVTTQWIPFYALMLLRTLDGGLSARARRKAALMAGLFFAFNGLAEMIIAVFLAIFTLIVVVIYLIDVVRNGRSLGDREIGDWRLAGSRKANLQSLISNLFILGVTAFLLWSPVLIPILIQFLTDNFALKGWGEAIPLSTDLLGWFTPTVLHPIFGGDLVAELRRVQLRALEMGVTGFRDLNTVFLGWVTLALALVGAFAWRSKVRIWIWTSIVFGLFTLGPFLQINGEYRFDLDGIDATFPMPYALLHYIPIVKANRAPNRNSVLLMLGLAVLVGYGVYWLLGKLKSKDSRLDADTQSSIFNLQFWVALLFAALILFEHLAIPAPLSDARIPAVYDQIAADPRPVSVLQVPLGWRNSFGVLGPERTQLQYYQTAHGKPMLGGNISRAPDFKMEYFARIPYFQALTQIEFGNPVPQETLDAARAQADELMYLYDTGYVLLFPPIPQRLPYADHWEESWAFVQETLSLEDEPFWAEDGIEAYRVIQPAGEDRFRLDLGTPGTYPYRGEGWDAAETDEPYAATATWATDLASRLFLPLRGVDPDMIYTVRMNVHPFAYPGASQQTLALEVNGQTLDARPLEDGWQEVTWEVPGSALVDGLNRLVLHWARAESPREVTPGSRQIGTTGVDLPMDADLKAFDGGAFIALFDEKGEQQDASAGRAGVNVTVLDPASGDVLEKMGFDTTANEYESQALAAFIDSLEPGLPVLVASTGDASAHLTPEAVDALRSLGADVSLDGLTDNYFVIVGVTGAQPGSAVLVTHPQEAFASVSLNRDRRALAGAVDWVEVMR